MRDWRGRLSVCMCASFPVGFESGKWDFIVLVSDPFYFTERSMNFMVFK